MQAINPKMQTLRPNIYVSSKDIRTGDKSTTSGSTMVSPSTGNSVVNGDNHHDDYEHQTNPGCSPARGQGLGLQRDNYGVGENGEK